MIMTTRIEQLAEDLNQSFGDLLKSNVLAVNEITIEVAPADAIAVCTKLRDDENLWPNR